MNVGASKPEEGGLFFQWGDTVGYTANQVGKDKQFASDWSDYKWYLSGSEKENNLKFSKYTNPGEALELEDDAAHVNMGGDWHMPTPTQIQELIDNTTNAWRTFDSGAYGTTFTSKKDSSKSIFIPAATRAWDGYFFPGGGDQDGYVWSCTLSADGDYYCNTLQTFEVGGAGLRDWDGFDGEYYRYRGQSVRGVIG